MHIEVPDTSRDVFDYEFNFANGATIIVPVDPSLGDRVHEGDTALYIYMAPREPLAPLGQGVPEDKITIFRDHLAWSSIKTRKVSSKTPEEQASWIKTLEELSSAKGIH